MILCALGLAEHANQGNGSIRFEIIDVSRPNQLGETDETFYREVKRGMIACARKAITLIDSYFYVHHINPFTY